MQTVARAHSLTLAFPQKSAPPPSQTLALEAVILLCSATMHRNRIVLVCASLSVILMILSSSHAPRPRHAVSLYAHHFDALMVCWISFFRFFFEFFLFHANLFSLYFIPLMMDALPLLLADHITMKRNGWNNEQAPLEFELHQVLVLFFLQKI